MRRQLPRNTFMQTMRGFGMVEVLVSISLFSVGLIGLAKLQMVSKQSNYEAVQRVTATNLAHDLLKRMRANPTQLEAFATSAGSNTLGGGTISSEPTPTCVGAGNTCTSAELAIHDLWEFERAVDGTAERDSSGNDVGGLHTPTVCISGPGDGSAGVYTIAIAWRGKNVLTNPTANTCGEATGSYGSSNEFRRLLVMQTYLDNQ